MNIRGNAKKKPKSQKHNFIVLTSSCGDISQGRYLSKHPTLISAKGAAEAAGKKKNYYGTTVEHKGVYIVQIVGKVESVCTTKYVEVK